MPPKKPPASTTATKKTPASSVRPPPSKAVASTASRTSKAAPPSSRPGATGTVAGKVAPKKVVPGGKSTSTAGKNVGGKKAEPTANGKGSGVPPKKKQWTKKDDMARKIQTAFRGYRCRKSLLELRRKREEYDTLMKKLEKDAFLHVVLMEREQAERERKKEEEERRRRREEQQRRKRMLEAAFDGDNHEIDAVLKELDAALANSPIKLHPVLLAKYRLALVDCTDANGNTPISEASAGGQPDTIRLLFKLGGDPNTKGAYGRTPLYRAAFGGHTEAVKLLLECGADPRMHADDGAVPEQIASHSDVKELLAQWDVSETESLQKAYLEKREKRLEDEQAFHKQEENNLTMSLEAAEKENSARQKELRKYHEELNKRIYEHDKLVAEGSDKTDITLKAIHDAEEDLESCRLRADQARENLRQARLKLREKQEEMNEGQSEEESVGVKVVVRELDDVLFRDVGNKMANDGRWPLIIDPHQQCTTFLRYRDTNYMNTLSQKDMAPNAIRLSIIGALRYGKYAILDLMDVDMWDAAVQLFDNVQAGLMESLLDKTILQKEKYISLLKPEDGDEYKPEVFLSGRMHNFRFAVITQLPSPPTTLCDRMYTIRVVPQREPEF